MSDAPADPPLFYQRHIFFCNNQRAENHPRGSCNARAEHLGGVEKVRAYARAKSQQLGIENIRCNGAGCLDRCEFGPNLVVYPEGVWYRYENTADIDEILETHVKNGGRVERLMLQPDQLPPGKH
jgi:(2Fe-2S) ferredoxin